MVLKLTKNSLLVFDLDDTLYAEADYVYSAFDELARLADAENHRLLLDKMISWFNDKQDVFENLLNERPASGLNKDILLEKYRHHVPSIKLADGAKAVLDDLLSHSIPMALITDGRSNSQRNKIRALGIEKYFSRILISGETGSEKITGMPFMLLEEAWPQCGKITIGDNINKDFAWPQKLGWLTIGIRNSGKNIHSQEVKEGSCLPQHYINSFAELTLNYD